jgi:hypothetical protein
VEVTVGRLQLANLAVFVVISACFSSAVYKIDHSAITDVRKAQTASARSQLAAQRAGRKIAGVCHRDIAAINEAHRSIRDGFELQAQIAQDNIGAIDTGLRKGLIPDALRAYYVRARGRQVANRDHFRRLAVGVTQLAPLC